MQFKYLQKQNKEFNLKKSLFLSRHHGTHYFKPHHTVILIYHIMHFLTQNRK